MTTNLSLFRIPALVALTTLSPLPAQAQTPIAVSNIITGVNSAPGNGTTFHNLGYTVDGAVVDSLLVITVVIEEGASTAVTGVTYGSGTFEKADGIVVDDGATFGYSGVWYLLNPDLDTAQNITVTTDGQTNTLSMTAFTLSNVNQSDPLGATATLAAPVASGPQSTQLTTQGSNSLLISTLMSGGSATDYVIAPSMSAVSSFINPAGSGVAMFVGSKDGGAFDSVQTLVFAKGTTNSPRVAIASAEFLATGQAPTEKINLTIAYNSATNELTLTWNALPGRLYTVRGSTDLNGFPLEILAPFDPPGDIATTTFAKPADPRMFYRVEDAGAAP